MMLSYRDKATIIQQRIDARPWGAGPACRYASEVRQILGLAWGCRGAWGHRRAHAATRKEQRDCARRRVGEAAGFLSVRALAPRYNGGVAEWPMAPVLKTGSRKGRGFESYPLRTTLALSSPTRTRAASG